MDRSDQAGVGRLVERDQAAPLQVLFQKDDGFPSRNRVLPIDRFYPLVHFFLEFSVGPDAAATGHADLNQRDSSQMLGMALEEAVDRLEPLGDSLRVVQTID